jgi:hypothetical protein
MKINTQPHKNRKKIKYQAINSLLLHLLADIDVKETRRNFRIQSRTVFQPTCDLMLFDVLRGQNDAFEAKQVADRNAFVIYNVGIQLTNHSVLDHFDIFKARILLQHAAVVIAAYLYAADLPF